MGLKKVEHRYTPSQVYNARRYLCAITAATAAIMIGYDSVFIGKSTSLSAFKKEFGLLDKTSSEFSFISSNIVFSTYRGGCFFRYSGTQRVYC